MVAALCLHPFVFGVFFNKKVFVVNVHGFSVLIYGCLLLDSERWTTMLVPPSLPSSQNL